MSRLISRVVDAYVTSYIRTAVPAGVAVVVAWLATHGLTLPDAAVLESTEAFTGYVFLGYYGLVRALEGRFPWVGWLLGKATEPQYAWTSKALRLPRRF
ncbi:hypothetical protein GCM10022221_67800 [Actinocorallia aurea]